MENYNTIPSVGTIGGMVTQINANFQLTKEMLERLSLTKDKSLGLFASLSALQAAHPSPEDGEWALVVDGSDIYLYTAANGAWVRGGTYEAGDVDLASYVTREEFDELDGIVTGGVTEREVTGVQWTNGVCVNANDGGTQSVGTSYNASSFIPLGTDTVSIRLLAMCIKPDTSGNTTMGIAFYDAGQQYMSGIVREVYDHGGSGAFGMVERTYNVPAGARYMRTTCMQGRIASWSCHTIGSGAGLVDKVGAMAEELDAAAEIARQAYGLASDADGIEPSHDVYRHASDPDDASSLTQAWHGLAFYTPVFANEQTFNSIIIKKLKAAAETTAEWRLYHYANTNTAYGGIPGRHDGQRGELLAQGTVEVETTAADITLTLDKLVCPAGEQLILYVLAAGTTLQAGRPDAVADDTHGTVYCAATSWGGTWYNAYPGNSAGYGCCAPVLRYESGILSKEQVESLVDAKLQDAGIDKTPTHEVYRHPTDPGTAASKTQAYRGHAVYTPSFAEDKRFNAVIVKGVSASEAMEVEWRVYVKPAAGRPYEDIPANSAAPQGTMVAGGTATVTTKMADITLSTGAVTCPAGSQVTAYLLNTSSAATITVGRPASASPDTHGMVDCSGGTWSANWYIGYPANGYMACAPVLMWLAAHMTRGEVAAMVDAKLASGAAGADDCKITLADEIYCLVGSEVNIYNERVSLSVDKGEKSPANYIVEWRKPSDEGGGVKRTEHGIRIRPTKAGKTTLKCILLDHHDNVLDRKDITVHAVAKDALKESKDILFVGDSWVQNANLRLYDILNGTDTVNDSYGTASKRFEGTCPTFRGTQILTARSEGRGGWTWKHFAEEDDAVLDEGGDIDTSSDKPFVDPSTGKPSSAYYRSKLGMGDGHFDMIVWRLGENDTTRACDSSVKTVSQYKDALSLSVIPYMDTLIRDFAADNPAAIIVITLQNQIDNKWIGYDGSLAYNFHHWEKMKAAYALNLLYHEWVETYRKQTGSTNVVLSNCTAAIDPFYGMQMTTIPVNDRWAQDKGGGRVMVGANVVHPSSTGYKQMADELAAEVAGRLGSLVTDNAAIGYAADGFYGNNDEEVVNGKGLHLALFSTAAEPAVTEGRLTIPTPQVYYYTRTNRMLGRNPATGKYYAEFTGDSLYMTGGHPRAGVVYWRNNTPYVYDGSVLQLLSDQSGGAGAVDQTARDAAAKANEAIARHALTFDVYDTGDSVPVDSGATTAAEGTMYYFAARGTFMLRVGDNYYSEFPNYPHAGCYSPGSAKSGNYIYYCGNQPYTADAIEPYYLTSLPQSTMHMTQRVMGEMVRTVTQEQYDALTESDKASRIYLIVEED